MTKQSRHVAVIGAGSWGTALGIVLARGGRPVRLVARDAARVEEINTRHENARYLPGIRLPDELRATTRIPEAVEDAAGIVLALPFQATRSVLGELNGGDAPVIAACKGLDPDRLQRTDEMLAETLPRARIALLSGPSFAVEVAKGQPTAITMAADTLLHAERAASLFQDTNFRIYTSDDPTGVALGGALKNVIAIAAGVAEGLGLGHNSIAAAVTRGLAEMARMATACGGRPETLMGLSGLGDLVLTCTGSLSRNRRFGIALAQGMDTRAALQHVGQTVEGVRTAAAAVRLAERLEIEVPLMRAVHRVIQGEIDIPSALDSLMNRPERPEIG